MQPQRLKVMTLVGTRPEIIKLSRVIAQLEAHTTHTLVHSGQNYDYELNEIFFRDLEIRRPDYFLEAAGGTVAESIGRIITKADDVMAECQPDALLLYGDTNTTLAAIAAKRRKIPVFHMEAGNRCYDDRVPEELNRRILDHISDINMPLTEHGRRALLSEGLPPNRVIKTGSTMHEVLAYYRAGIEGSDVLARLSLQPGEFFLVSTHREENVDTPTNLRKLIDTLNCICAHYDQPVVVSLHPRTRNRLNSLRESGEVRIDARVQMLPPFGFFDYVKMQTHARCVLSDSGTIAEESSLCGFPAVMIRETHERPEVMEEGCLIMSGLGSDRVLVAIDAITSQCSSRTSPLQPVADYAMDRVSEKILRIVLSYTDFVNRVVWSKPAMPQAEWTPPNRMAG